MGIISIKIMLSIDKYLVLWIHSTSKPKKNGMAVIIMDNGETTLHPDLIG